ncbi:MAG: hypothetical protein NDI62_02535 [Burkholderiales bacterium]|nr:hypothetical protein [Burkholderiales bacterium]
MKKLYLKSIGFWFALLVLALVNAGIREMIYKPILMPYIGTWAHQISSITGILIFFSAIYIFFLNIKEEYSKKDAKKIGFLWFGMTLIFETWMNLFLQNLSVKEILETYYFWNGETWIFVLASLVISPMIAYRILKGKN